MNTLHRSPPPTGTPPLLPPLPRSRHRRSRESAWHREQLQLKWQSLEICSLLSGSFSVFLFLSCCCGYRQRRTNALYRQGCPLHPPLQSCLSTHLPQVKQPGLLASWEETKEREVQIGTREIHPWLLQVGGDHPALTKKRMHLLTPSSYSSFCVPYCLLFYLHLGSLEGMSPKASHRRPLTSEGKGTRDDRHQLGGWKGWRQVAVPSQSGPALSFGEASPRGWTHHPKRKGK
mmetsp:Transcript_28228/g.71999  ORF Transcript_28228/g.71999 Transcript_28228/m.71999 type:complete len:232 (+) Transcript_28228:345-1040(+)